MNAVTRALLERRSVRRYASVPVPRDVAEKICAVATHAPNAGNARRTRVVLSFDDEANRRLGRINRECYAGSAPRAGAVSLDQPSIKDDVAIEDGYYGASVMAYVFGPNASTYRDIDAWILADQITLAAWAEGVGSCLVSRAAETFATPYGRECMRNWGVSDGYAACVQICLGYPENGFPAPRELVPDTVTVVG